MKKLLFLLLILIYPLTTMALSDSYSDHVSEIVAINREENKINLYLFYGLECPHCEQERRWLKQIGEDYKDYLNIYYFEVWHDEDNLNIMNSVKNYFELKRDSVPLTIIGNEYYFGFSDVNASKIENKIKEYAQLENNPNEMKLPIIGIVNIKNVSLPFVAMILGFIDGFNPCAMWILLFLINLLFDMKNKKRAWIIGLTFLFVSGIVYFLSMLGINLVLGITTIKWLKIIIAIFILMAGIFNLKKYFKLRKENIGCSVIDNKKRKKIIVRLHDIIEKRSFILAILGIIILAASVNLIELACSFGFPLVYTEILSINNVTGLLRIINLLIYIIFYMLDDIIVFTISMIT